MDGLPENDLSQLSKLEDDKYKMTYNYPDVYPVWKYAKNAEAHNKAYMGFHNRCLNNEDIVAQVINLRAEIAPLLGYDNHAAFVLEEHMAKTPETVSKFLDTLKDRILPKSKEDTDVLNQA